MLSAIIQWLCVCSATKADSANRFKEQAIYKLGQLLAKLGCAVLCVRPWCHRLPLFHLMFSYSRSAELAALLTDLRPFFTSLAKARTAKIGA